MHDVYVAITRSCIDLVFMFMEATLDVKSIAKGVHRIDMLG